MMTELVLLLIAGFFVNIMVFIGHCISYSLSDWKKWTEETKVKHLVTIIVFPVLWVFVLFTLYKLNHNNKIKKFLNKPIRKKGEDHNGKV